MVLKYLHSRHVFRVYLKSLSFMQYLRVSLAMLMKNSAASCIFQFNRSVVLSIFISNFILNYHMSMSYSGWTGRK